MRKNVDSQRKGITVRLSPENHKVVKRLAEKEGMSMAKWVEFLIAHEIRADRDSRKRAA